MKDTKLDTSIKFNWNEILKYSRYDCNTALKIIKYFAGIGLLSHKEKEIVSKLSKKDFPSWLHDPIGFFTTKTSNLDKCSYLMIASRRNKADYKLNEVNEIPFYMVDDLLDIRYLQYNSLFEVNEIKQVLILKY